MEKDEPTLQFPYGWDEQIAIEASQRGLYYHAVVQLPNGERVRVGFYDSLRVAQDIERNEGRPGSHVAIPGMIVVPKVTLEHMKSAIKELYRGDFFEELMGLRQADE